jgi:hypothetical protein
MVLAATSGWTVVAALGAAIGGIGAAVGGWAAWKAASASRATSRDAMEALGLAIAPTLAGDATISPILDGSETANWQARIANVSGQFAASRLHFEARFEDGTRVDQELERLEPGHTWEIPLRVIGMPPGGPLPEEARKASMLRYSRRRRIFSPGFTRSGLTTRATPWAVRCSDARPTAATSATVVTAASTATTNVSTLRPRRGRFIDSVPEFIILPPLKEDPASYRASGIRRGGDWEPSKRTTSLAGR